LKPTPGQPEKAPMHIPLALGLLDAQGQSVALRLEGEPAGAAAAERVLNVTAPRQSFRFVNLPQPKALSLNRRFSAPVTLKAPQTAEERAFLMAHDPDPFARWEAGQQYATDLLLREILRDAALEPAFAAEAITLPGEDYLAERMEIIDVEGIHDARETLRRQIADALGDELGRVYAAHQARESYRPDAAQAGRRALKNAALSYLAARAGNDAAVRSTIVEQYRRADNMTDRIAALRLLVDIDGPERQAALDDFYARFRDDPLVTDKWLALQAISSRPDTLQRVADLLAHAAFSLRNPNKVRALIGSFTTGNPLRYHAADGGGYDFHAARTIELDAINRQVAARLLAPLGRWRRFDPGRQAKMKAALERILAAPTLSRDVYEIASKSLA
jgi:aminopeptidase N